MPDVKGTKQDTKQGAKQSKPRVTRLVIIDTLHQMGGGVRDVDGLATGRLARGIGEMAGVEVSEKTLVNTLRRMEQDGLIRREVVGKRTMAIELAEGHIEQTGESAEGSAGGGDGGGDGEVDYARLAVALLDRVGEVLVGGDTRRWDEMVQRLGEVEGERARLAKQLVVVGEELHAVKQERDGLRKRLRVLEGNVDALMRAEAHGDDGEKAKHRREMQKLMRQART